jgi:hypothetical protein
VSMSTFAKRVEKLEMQLEQRARIRSRLDPKCICYPEGTVPWVGFPILEWIAFLVKCPLHGDRFKPGGFFLYVSKWMRENQHRLILNRLSYYIFSKRSRQVSEQYRKAYLASFPSDLWPGQEEDEKAEYGPKIFLRLKDGTRFQVCKHHFSKPFRWNPGDELKSDVTPARADPFDDEIWETETLLTVGRLLSGRGLIVDPLFCGKE